MRAPEILKSSRHAKITGDFAEALVLYWLSKHGFECARVDHTGIDLIARNPSSRELLGISVKSRSRLHGSGSESVGIENEHLAKCQAACRAFGCRPYYAIVVDADSKIEAFIVPEDAFEQYAPTGKSYRSWKMGVRSRAQYYTDRRILRFEMSCSTLNWWRQMKPKQALERNRR